MKCHLSLRKGTRSIPDTWVTDYSEDIGNTFASERVFDGLEPARLVIEVTEIILHEADEPDLVGNLFDAHLLAGKRSAQVNLLPVVTDSAVLGHDNGSIMKRIVELAQAGIRPGRFDIEVCRDLHH